MDLFKEMEKELDQYEDRKISFDDLYPEEFMQEYTDYNSISEMLSKSDFEIEKQDDFENIPEDEWNDYIDNCTDFDNWEEMRSKAVKEWVEKDLDRLYG